MRRIFGLIEWIFKFLLGSLHNKEDGASGRKLTALWFTILATFVNYNYTNEHNATTMLLIDVGTSLLCLGIITFEQIIKFKNSKTDFIKTETTSSETTTIETKKQGDGNSEIIK